MKGIYNMKIICIGDSLTQGFGVSKAECWVELVNNKTKMDIVNKGINGDTTAGMLARFQMDVVVENPKYVIIMGGVNDIIFENSHGAIQSNIMAMAHQAYYHNIIPIVGISIKADRENFRKVWLGITDVSVLNQKISEYRNLIAKFSRAFNIMTIDFYAEFDNKIQGEYGRYLLDGLHPSKEGHQILADIASEYIKFKL